MYCKKCELEIKGDDQNRCPLCNAELVEGSGGAHDGADDQELSDLIQDINASMDSTEQAGPETDSSMNLELDADDATGMNAAEEQAFELRDDESADAELSSAEPELSLDAPGDLPFGSKAGPDGDEVVPAEPELSLDASGDLSFAHDEAVPGDESAPAEPELSLDAPGDLSPELQSALPDDTHDDEPALNEALPADTPQPVADDFSGPEEDAEPETVSDQETLFSDEPEEMPAELFTDDEADRPGSELDGVFTDAAGGSTSESLAEALAELDEEHSAVPPASPKRASRTPALALVLVLLACAGAAYYFFAMPQSAVTPPPKATPAKKTEKVLRKVLKREQAAVTKSASGQKQMPDAAAEAGAGSPPAKPTHEKQIPSQPAAARPSQAAAAEKKPVPPKQPLVKADGISPAKEVRANIAAEGQTVPTENKPDKKQAPPAAKAGRFTIHIASYRNKASADGERDRFVGMGFEAFVQTVTLKESGVWYRVKAGSYQDAEQARAALQALRKKDAAVGARVVQTR